LLNAGGCILNKLCDPFWRLGGPPFPLPNKKRRSLNIWTMNFRTQILVIIIVLTLRAPN